MQSPTTKESTLIDFYTSKLAMMEQYYNNIKLKLTEYQPGTPLNETDLRKLVISKDYKKHVTEIMQRYPHISVKDLSDKTRGKWQKAFPNILAEITGCFVLQCVHDESQPEGFRNTTILMHLDIDSEYQITGSRIIFLEYLFYSSVTDDCDVDFYKLIGV